MRTRYAIALTALCAIAAAFIFAPKREIVTEIRIDAPPAAVWDVLTDGASYPDWNPFIVKMEGEVAVGEVLSNTIQPTDGEAMAFSPKVLKASKNQELRWLGSFIIPRVFDGEHFFVLTADGSGTRLNHGERFRGIMLWFMDIEPFKANFEAMNVALAREVQARAQQ